MMRASISTCALALRLQLLEIGIDRGLLAGIAVNRDKAGLPVDAEIDGRRFFLVASVAGARAEDLRERFFDLAPEIGVRTCPKLWRSNCFPRRCCRCRYRCRCCR